jgi:hypothetical protein
MHELTSMSRTASVCTEFAKGPCSSFSFFSIGGKSVVSTSRVVAHALVIFGGVTFVAACASHKGNNGTSSSSSATQPGGGGGSSSSSSGCTENCDGPGDDGSTPPGDTPTPPAPTATDGVKNGDETDVDCGGSSGKKCAVGKTCAADGDCDVACGYNHQCVEAASCATHLGGDTCGLGEVGGAGAAHESCCRSLEVKGYSDTMHPGKKVYLDKYEITAGRIREWIKRMATEMGGKPDVKGWIAAHRPAVWDPAWEAYLPSDFEGGNITINRRLLGDPRPEDNNEKGPPGPGVILPPATDQVKNLGVNHQFGSEVYVDIHGSDCASWDGAFGFATYWYPPDQLAKDGEKPRADGTGYDGSTIPAQDLLDVKAMNCIPNDMLAAFCAWDGGQLATDEVLDYITSSPPSLGYTSGCGTQIDDHGELLGNIFTHTVQTGGACPAVPLINATFDAGDNLPVPNSPLNMHNYHYPDLGNQTFDKAWQVSAPGRASLAKDAGGAATDAIRLSPTDEPWMDLAGNLSESAFDMSGGAFTGLFTLKYRGIGYGSARSDLNITLMKGETVLRIQRPEAKAAFTGGRCMRFR